MRIEFTFDTRKIEEQGYALHDIYGTIKKNFAARNLPCVSEQDALVFTDNGAQDDYANMWSLIMALLRKDWFMEFADSCVWFEDDGSEEDVLSQAWKVRGRRMA